MAGVDLPACGGLRRLPGRAEIEQAVIASALRALQARRPLDIALVTAELGATVPLSVPRAEDVGALRDWAAGRFVPVS